MQAFASEDAGEAARKAAIACFNDSVNGSSTNSPDFHLHDLHQAIVHGHPGLGNSLLQAFKPANTPWQLPHQALCCALMTILSGLQMQQARGHLALVAHSDCVPTGLRLVRHGDRLALNARQAHLSGASELGVIEHDGDATPLGPQEWGLGPRQYFGWSDVDQWSDDLMSLPDGWVLTGARLAKEGRTGRLWPRGTRLMVNREGALQLPSSSAWFSTADSLRTREAGSGIPIQFQSPGADGCWADTHGVRGDPQTFLIGAGLVKSGKRIALAVLPAVVELEPAQGVRASRVGERMSNRWRRPSCAGTNATRRRAMRLPPDLVVADQVGR